MTDSLRAYALETAYWNNMPLSWGDDLGDDAIEAAMEAIDNALNEAKTLHLWPQPCRCSAAGVSRLCDYHDERHEHVTGGQAGPLYSWYEDDQGRRWESSAWEAIRAAHA